MTPLAARIPGNKIKIPDMNIVTLLHVVTRYKICKRSDHRQQHQVSDGLAQIFAIPRSNHGEESAVYLRMVGRVDTDFL